MSSDEWTRVAAEAELADGQMKKVKAGEDTVLLVRLGERICACGNECPHYHAPLTSGVLRGRSVTCPWHNARFDVTSGKLEAAPALNHLPTYPVKVENGEVFVGAAEKTLFPKITEQDNRCFVIVGAGAAGNAAAETLRREGFAGRIVLITGEDDRPYDRPNLSKEYLSGEAKPAWIPLRSEKFDGQRQIDLLTGRPVTAVDPAQRTVTLTGGQQTGFDRLLLATGAEPRRLTIPGAELPGSFVLRSLADSTAILTAIQTASRAVVLGASFIGLEVAASLRHRGLEVCVAAPGSVPMARVFGERIGRRVQRLHEANGVTFHLGAKATEIAGRDKVEAVMLSDGSRLEADVVIAGIGVTPAVGYLDGSGLVADGAVPVDGRLQTTAEGIFAAGDIAAVPDPRTGRPQRIEHWVVAERHGQHAARAMLGSDQAYDEVPFFWSMQYDTSIEYIGHARQYDRIAYRGDVEDGKFLAGYYQDGVLLAAAGMGLAKQVIIVGQLLKAGTNVSFEQFEDDAVDLKQLLPS